ncbi:MAG: hypothetical protein V2A54_01770 [Bacteroidota bacterium]
MPTCFIITHIVAALAAATLVTGIITVLRGFIFKIEKTITRGTIYVAVAVFVLAGVHMMGKMHHMDKCGGDNKCKTEMKCGDMHKGKGDMKGGPHMFMKCFEGGDENFDIVKHIMMMDGKGCCDMPKCDPSKCDTSMCKKEVKVEIKKTK